MQSNRICLFCEFEMTAMSKKNVPSDMCSQQRLKSACPFAQSNKSLRSALKKLGILDYTKCTQ